MLSIISRRFYSCKKSNCVSAPQLIKYLEQSIVNVGTVHSDIYTRQEYIQRQINDVYLDINYLDMRHAELANTISRINVRLDSIEQELQNIKK